MAKLFSLLRALILPFLLCFHTAWCSVVAVAISFFGAPRAFTHWFIHDVWSRGLLFFTGVKVILEGVDNVPKEGGFLYLFTHSSHFDIPVLFTHSPRDFRFGAKAELFDIPFFGRAMTITGTLPIARGDRAQVMEVYRKAEERVKNGEVFALAPEGGRRKVEDIAPFKSGPFIFAINCKMPIVPVVISGTDKVLKKGSLLVNYGQWNRKVGVRFLPPVETRGIDPNDAKSLREKVRNDVVAHYEDFRKNFE